MPRVQKNSPLIGEKRTHKKQKAPFRNFVPKGARFYGAISYFNSLKYLIVRTICEV